MKNKDNFEPLFELIEQIEGTTENKINPILNDAEDVSDIVIPAEDELAEENQVNETVLADEEPLREEEKGFAIDEDVEEGFSLDSFSDFSEEPTTKAEKKKGFVVWWKARKTWQKALMISGISFVLVFSILLGVVLSAFDYNYNSLPTNPTDLGFENVVDKNIVNIALFGIDTRSVNSFEGNSDSIMILSLNTITKKVKIISVMRDSLVPITYNGKTTYGKINGAYSKGGPELAVKTLNKIFGLDISEYATVNFFGMVDIIDAIGDIEAELTQGEVTKNTNKKAINFCIEEICHALKLDAKKYKIYKPGKQTLNGVQAVAYSRIRYVQNIWGTSNDYGRTDRQRYVMEQLFNKALTLDKSKYIKLAKSLIPCSETSLSYKEIMGLAFDILLESPTFEQTRMPQEEFLMNSPSGSFGSVVYYDLDFAKEVIHAFIYNGVSPEKYIETNGVTKNDWYRNRFPSSGSNNHSNSGQAGNSNQTGQNDNAYDPDSSVSDSSDITDGEEWIDDGTGSDIEDGSSDISSDITSDTEGTDSDTEGTESGNESTDLDTESTDSSDTSGTDSSTESGNTSSGNGSSESSNTSSSTSSDSGSQGGSVTPPAREGGTTPSTPSTGT